MSIFNYQGYDASGGKIAGQIESENAQSAMALLKQQGLLITELKSSEEAGGFSIFASKITLSDLEFFTNELYLLLSSGVRIDKGLDIIRKSKAKPALAKLLSDISKDLKQGIALSTSLAKHDQLFEPLYINLVELGEASGNLTEVFESLAKDLKFKREMRSKIIGALTYPMVILAVCVLAIGLILNLIIPQMASLFNDVTLLPWYTQFLLASSEFTNTYQVELLGGLAVFCGLIYWVVKQPQVKKALQYRLLSFPFIGNMIRSVERIRFSSAMAMMIKAGLTIDKALSLANGSVNNQTLRNELQVARNKIKQGSSLTPALRQASIYPSFYVSLLEVGEESGNMEKVFNEITARSRSEFEEVTSRMTTLIEPLMILIMGGIVGSVVVIMMMSIVSVNDVNF